MNTYYLGSGDVGEFSEANFRDVSVNPLTKVNS